MVPYRQAEEIAFAIREVLFFAFASDIAGRSITDTEFVSTQGKKITDTTIPEKTP